MDPDALLADLDLDQRRAVTCDSRLVAVVAGAGSGKTRVLTRRVAYRVATGTADAGHTVVLTFTREAAGELRRRLPRLGLTERVTAGTFHSVASGLLRQRWRDLDRPAKSILTDRKRVVGDLMGRSDLDALVAEMDWAITRGLDPDGYQAAVRRGDRRSVVDASRVADALDRYHREKHRRGVIDLDDLLGLTIDEMRRSAEFADAVRWRFRHVLVDEAQDLNPLQHQLVDALRHGHDDLFLVGDPAQSIYGFNGSDPTLLVDVSDRFPGVEVIRLPVNHRCTPQVVEAGAFALRAGGQPTDIRSERPDGPAVDVVGHADEVAEAAAVTRHIARLDPTAVRSGQVAVLARTHAALTPMRDALHGAGVTIRRTIDTASSPLRPVLDQVYRFPDSPQLRQWVQNQLETRDGPDGDTPAVPATRPDLAPNVEVALAVLDFLREQPTGDGTELRNWVDRTDPFGSGVPGVELLTFHGAKGREWHTVFLLGCETGLVPHRSATTQAARAEEARLLYVALTRATDALHVNWSERRGGYQRKLTPLLDGFSSETPAVVAPPPELRRSQRTERSVTLERLHEWRAGAARAGGILPDAVCSDHALSLIVDHRPNTPDELDAVTGMGRLTAGRLFDGIRSALSTTVATVD